jgi:hypothetical protein
VFPVESFPLSEMGLVTKNRQNQTAELCREHLRSAHATQGSLVEDFIREIEGRGNQGISFNGPALPTWIGTPRRCADGSMKHSADGSEARFNLA